MGTWGSGPFDNDAAADWLDQLDADASREQISGALRAAFVDGPISADAAAIAVAAAEVVANGEAQRMSAQTATDGELARLALAALERISTDSALATLWDEVGGEEWHAHLEQVRVALRQRRQGRSAMTSPADVATYTCSRRGHTKRLLTQTAASLAVAVWHAETAARGDRSRLVGVRAELSDVIQRHADPTCPIRDAAGDHLRMVDMCVQDPARALDGLVPAIRSLQERVGP